jgi:hypothetical protein
LGLRRRQKEVEEEKETAVAGKNRRLRVEKH